MVWPLEARRGLFPDWPWLCDESSPHKRVLHISVQTWAGKLKIEFLQDWELGSRSERRGARRARRCELYIKSLSKVLVTLKYGLKCLLSSLLFSVFGGLHMLSHNWVQKEWVSTFYLSYQMMGLLVVHVHAASVQHQYRTVYVLSFFQNRIGRDVIFSFDRISPA